MCGLTALVGTDIRAEDILAFQKLAQLSALRGQDSVGFFDFHLAPPRNEKPIRYYKETGSAGLYFGEGGRWDANFYWPRYHTKKGAFNAPVVLVAHARAATKGEVNKKNAHPFVCGDLIGVHNGTIHPDFEGRKEYDTDSEALYAYMAKHGEQNGLNMVNKMYNAAYALMWINLKERTFNIARNDQRTLYFSVHKHRDVCFLSSDRLFLKAVIQYIDKNYEDPAPVVAEEWFVFELNKKNVLRTRETVKIQPKINTYTPPPATTQQGQSVVPFPRHEPPSQSTNSNSAGDSGKNQTSGKNKSTTWEAHDILADELSEEDVPFRVKIHEFLTGAPYEIRDKVYKNFRDYTRILTAGCECCGHKPHTYEGSYVFKDEVTFLCDTCAANIDCVRIVAEDVRDKMEAVSLVDNKPAEEKKTETIVVGKMWDAEKNCLVEVTCH